MKVILNEDNKNLGKRGDIVNVSDGFAFNSLIPSGMASPATKEAMVELERKKAQEEAMQAEKAKVAQETAKELDKKKITIVSKAEGNKLFGSVDKKQIAEAIKEQRGVEVDEKMIVLDEPIKELTTREVEVDYGFGAKAGVIVTISSK